MGSPNLFPASLRQLQDWVNHINLKPNQKPSVMSFSIREKDLCVDSLKKTIKDLFIRHESLRTFFIAKDDTIYQCISDYSEKVFGLKYFSQINNTAVTEIYNNYFNKLKKIQSPPLCYSLLFKTEKGFLFYFVIHHIICDYDSIEILKHELGQLYNLKKRDSPDELPKIVFHLKDYFALDKQNRKSSILKSKQFWKKNLLYFEKEFLHKKYYSGLYLYDKKNTVGLDEEKLLKTFNSKTCNIFIHSTNCNAVPTINSIQSKHRFGFGPIIYSIFYIMLLTLSDQKNHLIASPISGRHTKKSMNLVGNLMGGIYYPIEKNELNSLKKLIVQFQNLYLKTTRHIIYNHGQLSLNGLALRINCDLYLNIIKHQVEQNCGTLSNIHSSIEESSFYALECVLMKSSSELILNWRYNPLFYRKSEIDLMTKKINDYFKKLSLVSNLDIPIERFVKES